MGPILLQYRSRPLAGNAGNRRVGKMTTRGIQQDPAKNRSPCGTYPAELFRMRDRTVRTNELIYRLCL